MKTGVGKCLSLLFFFCPDIYLTLSKSAQLAETKVYISSDILLMLSLQEPKPLEKLEVEMLTLGTESFICDALCSSFSERECFVGDPVPATVREEEGSSLGSPLRPAHTLRNLQTVSLGSIHSTCFSALSPNCCILVGFSCRLIPLSGP